MNSISDHLVLNTGASMPVVGLGTWNAAPDQVGHAVEYAFLECGYRHIDCAAIYKNEKEIGEALTKVLGHGAVKREEVFITSKLWNTAHAKGDAASACQATLSDLGLDYLDLYLMHWGVATPADKGDEPLDKNGILITGKIPIRETWQAMEDLVRTGLARAIGVSNFTAPMILDILSYAKILPAVNQIELHPYLQQSKLVAFCHYKNIAVTAYSPLGSSGGWRDRKPPILLDDKDIVAIARNHNKSPARVLIRWAIQRNTVAIPKSTTPEHIKSNMDVFGFELSEEEMNFLKTLDRKLRFVNPEEWWNIPYFD